MGDRIGSRALAERRRPGGAQADLASLWLDAIPRTEQRTAMRDFFLAFIPIFIAVDPAGVLPMFIGLTEDLDAHARRRAIRHSVLTALLVGIAFVLAGKTLFALLGITVDDFLIAGGTLLFLIATLDLVSGRKFARSAGSSVGVVPLGTPLMVGPAVLTTSLMLVDLCGPVATLAALVTNVVLMGLILLGASAITRVLGEAGIRAITKIVSLFLAAIAVMMVRKGIVNIVLAAQAA